MSDFHIPEIVAQLRLVRDQWREQQRRTDTQYREFPSRDAVARTVDALKGVLYPLRLGPPDLRQAGEDFYIGHTLDTALHTLLAQARIELHYRSRAEDCDANNVTEQATQAIRLFGQALPALRQLLDTDVLAAFQGDPAARSVDEVVLSYPGVLALIYHRMAHTLYGLELPLLARIVDVKIPGQNVIDIYFGA